MISAAESLNVMTVARTAVHLAAHIIDPRICYPVEDAKGENDLRQKHVDLMLGPGDLVCSIDDFSERNLMPAMHLLVEHLKRDGIKRTHPLPLETVSEGSAARVQYDGWSMRATLTRAPHGADGLDSPHDLLRFDVLYSV